MGLVAKGDNSSFYENKPLLIPLNVLNKIDMNKFALFVKDSYKELVYKVTWPNWDQLMQSTMIVLGATLLITAVVGVMDFLANNAMKFIYSLFK